MWPRGSGKPMNVSVGCDARVPCAIGHRNCGLGGWRQGLANQCVRPGQQPRCPSPEPRAPSLRQSCSTTLNSELLILIPPLYSMNPNFRKRFMKKFTRERVVPIISASTS